MVAVGGLAVVAAQPPADPPVKPAGFTDIQQVPAARPTDGTAALPQALADARAAYAQVRDYTCVIERQERVGGTLRPTQTGELRVRTRPLSINVKVTAPKPVAGQETSYISGRNLGRVRFKPAGVDGIKYGFQTLPKDDPKVLADTRHPVTEVGLLAVIDRVERILKTEKMLNHPAQVLTAAYTFAGRPVTKFEVFADRPHANRYAARVAVYFDAETKLPVRFEAYDAPKPGATTGEVVEVVSFAGIRTNVGLGEAAFER
jgi:hypothetical protein